MAEKRMFAKQVVDSDAFLDMPLSAQALYFHLNMRADDDGFVSNPRKIQRMIGSSDDDIRLLLAKRFILAFESGVIVIKHWKLNNSIRKDRYKPTLYQEEFAMLVEKENGSYTDRQPLGIPSDNQRLPQISIGKVSNNILSEKPDKKAQINAHFEQLWKMYPRKEGKGRVSATQKKKLYNIGLEEMTRAVERYKEKIKADGIQPQYVQMGSTFFNSGYVDYLDENATQGGVEPDKPIKRYKIETVDGKEVAIPYYEKEQRNEQD